MARYKVGAVLLLVPVIAAGTTRNLLDEEFDTLTGWEDLSTAITWGGNPAGSSCFVIDNGAVKVQPGVRVPYNQLGSLMTFSCLDFLFPQPVFHGSEEMVIDFRARWAAMRNSGKGEANRFVLSLTYDYPGGVLDLTPDLHTMDFSQDWWGRPSYQVRMRGADAGNGTTLLMYGGGLDPLGEFEAYAPLNHWLPGFNSAPGGYSPGLFVSEGSGLPGDHFPDVPWVHASHPVPSVSYKVFRFAIFPDRLEFWVDHDDTGPGGFTLMATMPTPETAPANASNVVKTYYNYFSVFSGIRMYWAKSNTKEETNVWVDWMRIRARDAFDAPDYSNWALATITTPKTGHDEDSDGDGLKNRVEFCMGTDPMAFTPAPLFHYDPDSDVASIEYTQRMDSAEAIIQPQWSNDLTSWSGDGVTLVNQGDDGNVRSLRAEVNGNGTDPVFLRLIFPVTNP